jgi:putative nucleotidyltransferase with HDIG domain
MGIFVSLGLGILVSNRVTDRIEKIVDGTRHIAADDLDFQVQVRGHDEITELAGSFNKMASTLCESKKKLRDYFFRVVQSLVRILEAKDPYTCGHSERVAEYSEKIASVIGFSQNKIELLKKAAELHDIGKLAIHQDILNKKGKLTPEEWKIIREHPVVGEQVLKPILIDKELIEMVRSHHERYDGKGYPDKIKGDNISIFAQIISVADAYDAMTSPRAYRPTFSKETAITELRANCGTQFNTQIVEAFLKFLEEEQG